MLQLPYLNNNGRLFYKIINICHFIIFVQFKIGKANKFNKAIERSFNSNNSFIEINQIKVCYINRLYKSQLVKRFS